MYSLFQKLKRKQMESDKIYDIVALRLIVPTIADCYSALGVIPQRMAATSPRRIKDYVRFQSQMDTKVCIRQSSAGRRYCGNADRNPRKWAVNLDSASHPHLAIQSSGKRKKQNGAIGKDLPWINQDS